MKKLNGMKKSRMFHYFSENWSQTQNIILWFISSKNLQNKFSTGSMTTPELNYLKTNESRCPSNIIIISIKTKQLINIIQYSYTSREISPFSHCSSHIFRLKTNPFFFRFELKSCMLVTSFVNQVVPNMFSLSEISDSILNVNGDVRNSASENF